MNIYLIQAKKARKQEGEEEWEVGEGQDPLFLLFTIVAVFIYGNHVLIVLTQNPLLNNLLSGHLS